MFVEVRGHPVHTVIFGSGERTVVGIAGAFGTWEIWQQPFELLSQRHRVIGYDHFGAGETRVPADLVTFDHQVALVHAVLDAHSVERCLLAGDSSMVAVAVAAALREPERIEALALVAGGVVHHPNPVTTAFVAGLRSDFEATLRPFVDACIPERDSQHLREWLLDIIRRTGGERAATLVESFYGVDLSSRLAELQMPTAVIQGELDSLPVSDVDAARRMAAAISDCTLEILPGVGHVPTLTRPAAVAEAIERVLERVPSPG